MTPFARACDALARVDGAPVVLRGATVPTAALADRGLARADEDAVRVDIGVSGGRIRAVTAADGEASDGWACVDLAGGMVWPCFVEAHAHLDSGQIWARAPNPDGSFPGAQGAMFDFRDRMWTAVDMRRRMAFGLRCAYAHGTRAIRTHLASQNDQVEERWAIYRELRAEWAGRISLQASSLIALEALAEPAALERLAALVTRSDGVLGAFAPMQPGIEAALHPVFAAAERHGLALDFHADETADPSSQVLAAIARVAIERRFTGPVLVGHSCSLATQDQATADRTLDLVAEAGLSIVSLPACNQYLQDRETGRTPRWRGVTLLHEMRSRGIAVALGGDNCRDPFHAYGDNDMLETFRDGVRVAHLDHPFGDWPAAVSRAPAAMLGEPTSDIGAGEPADLVLFAARSFNELLARPHAGRIVMRAGRTIAANLPQYDELDEAIS